VASEREVAPLGNPRTSPELVPDPGGHGVEADHRDLEDPTAGKPAARRTEPSHDRPAPRQPVEGRRQGSQLGNLPEELKGDVPLLGSHPPDPARLGRRAQSSQGLLEGRPDGGIGVDSDEYPGHPTILAASGPRRWAQPAFVGIRNGGGEKPLPGLWYSNMLNSKPAPVRTGSLSVTVAGLATKVPSAQSGWQVLWKNRPLP
jgi:hypothetical protein